jgi:GTP-binding protein
LPRKRLTTRELHIHHHSRILLSYAMNTFSPNSRYVCRNCIRHLSRQPFTRPQLRAQSTDAAQDAVPEAGRPGLRIKKHWNDDVGARIRIGSPTNNVLHLSKTKANFRLELGEEQKPQLSMRERRQLRRAPSMSVKAGLPGRVRRKLRGQLADVDTKEAAEQVVPTVPSPPPNAQPQSRFVAFMPTVLPRKSVAMDTPRQSRRARSNEVVEELRPSKPSPPLGVKPKPETPLTIPPPESPPSHVKLHHSNLEDFNWYWESYPPTIAQKTQANHFFTNHGKSAKLLRSVAQFRLFPESDVPEVAFVGRSNVGKSSLLNAVVNADIKALLARTSTTRGFTKTMNLYGMGPGNSVTLKKQPDGRDNIVGLGGLTIVDMPGYGSGSLSSWGTEIMKYIRSRKQLRRVFVLLDAEHGIKDKDRSLLASLRLSGVSHQIILSKLDKLYIPKAKEIKRFDGKSLKRLSAKGTVTGLRMAMEKLKPDIQPPVGGGALGEIIGVSAETLVDGKRLGIDHVRFAVLKAAGLDQKFQKDVSTPWANDK